MNKLQGQCGFTGEVTWNHKTYGLQKQKHSKHPKKWMQFNMLYQIQATASLAKPTWNFHGARKAPTLNTKEQTCFPNSQNIKSISWMLRVPLQSHLPPRLFSISDSLRRFPVAHSVGSSHSSSSMACWRAPGFWPSTVQPTAKHVPRISWNMVPNKKPVEQTHHGKYVSQAFRLSAFRGEKPYILLYRIWMDMICRDIFQGLLIRLQ